MEIVAYYMIMGIAWGMTISYSVIYKALNPTEIPKGLLAYLIFFYIGVSTVFWLVSFLNLVLLSNIQEERDSVLEAYTRRYKK